MNGEGERGKGFCGNKTIRINKSLDKCGRLLWPAGFGDHSGQLNKPCHGEWVGRNLGRPALEMCPLNPCPGGPGRVKGHVLESCNPQVTPFVLSPKAQVQVNLPERGQDAVLWMGAWDRKGRVGVFQSLWCETLPHHICLHGLNWACGEGNSCLVRLQNEWMAWEVYQVEGITRITAQSMNKLAACYARDEWIKENDLLMSNQTLNVIDEVRIGTSIFQHAIHCCSPSHMYSLVKTQTVQNYGIVASRKKLVLSSSPVSHPV